MFARMHNRGRDVIISNTVSPRSSNKVLAGRVKSEIERLLYRPSRAQTDKELLSITVLSSKAYLFDFLKGYTRLEGTGKWRTYADEANAIIEIEFRDTPDERVGNKLMELLTAYNKYVVKEDLLYARTTPIEESTL
jgi:hypothetical protein